MYKQRLRRLDSLFTDAPVYFLTACTLNRRLLLANPEVHQIFGVFATRAVKVYVTVGRFVLMPDHVHLFAAFGPRSPTLSKWMKALKGALSSGFRTAGIAGLYWQDGFFDHVLRSEESYAEKWLYVHQNPVRAGLVKRAEDWPFQGEIFPLL